MTAKAKLRKHPKPPTRSALARPNCSRLSPQQKETLANMVKMDFLHTANQRLPVIRGCGRKGYITPIGNVLWEYGANARSEGQP